jgi:Skp family chaperone for outer membrane proteins
MTNIHDINMKRKILILAAGLFWLALFAETATAAQEKAGAANIAVVDVQSLMQNSNAAKNARTQIDKMRTDYQKDFQGKQEEMNKLFRGMARERPMLSQEAYQQRMGELQQRAASYENEMQERQGKLDDALRGASQKIAAAMTQIVDEIIKEQKLTLVLPRSISIGTPTAPDITQEVLKRLNQRIPTVSVQLPR